MSYSPLAGDTGKRTRQQLLLGNGRKAAFYAIYADGCARKNGYRNRRTMFSMGFMPRAYKRDKI
jgi:hypothetical protein